MMGWLPLSFGAPLVLAGLLALPLIWWLLRLTPPRPQEEVFPPLRILARVLKREETPNKSPWWLTLLRLLMAALIVLALAEPVFNPREKLETGGNALALVMDNGWASAPDWERRVATAERLLTDAADAGIPVVLALTAEKENSEIGPFDAEAARARLNAAQPRPVPVNRAATYGRVAAALAELPGATVAVLTDGLETAGDRAAFDALLTGGESRLVWIEPDRLDALALTGTQNNADAFTVTAVRAADPAPRQATLGAFDERGRRIADATLAFGPSETSATASFTVPFELRNDFHSISIDGERQAGAIRVLDENSRRRRVGLISQGEADQAQPLLSPLYYIRRALGPFADLVEPNNSDLAVAIPQLIERNPAMIIMADVGTLPGSAHAALADWVEKGGTLLRFAGPRLAASTDRDDELLPVRLRQGERSLGGALSWAQPQPVAEFPATGPFAGLTPPREVSVEKQVLAEPGADIVERTWANLADGTPLVTGASLGEGTVVLFHVTPEATWSNLPISGSFVEMLRRIAQLSRNQGRVSADGEARIATLPPWRLISAEGGLVPPPPGAMPMEVGPGRMPAVTVENPPGLYGGDDGVIAHNLLPADAALTRIARPRADIAVTEASYAFDESRPLKGPLVIAALILMALDTLIVFWLGGMFARRPKRQAGSTAAMIAALGLAAGLSFQPPQARAQDNPPQPENQVSDSQAVDAISRTRIAYVITGDSSIDAISRAGMAGLSRYLQEKTALEPGEPAGVDIERDELAFYPIIYWPIDAAAAMPSEAAIARIDAYMHQGGTVLFDTRDQFAAGFDLDNSASPATMRLREILGDLNVPPLEPVPDDHVLTKSFYIMPDFPGRYRGSPLWVEASAANPNDPDRPVRAGDGVTPIMITANDLAGAWAIDAAGEPMLPTVPADPMQRVYALRGGVNIIMYMLTGNYKSDQVHIPVLLERLGQ
jgi:hypothetical protein